MVRYFATIPEAGGLALEVATVGQSGEILILDMGEPVRIAELAESVVRMSGLEAGVGIAIEFRGLRPGEKLFEELNLEHEIAEQTPHSKVPVGRSAESACSMAQQDFEGLMSAAESLESSAEVLCIKAAVPKFTHG